MTKCLRKTNDIPISLSFILCFAYFGMLTRVIEIVNMVNIIPAQHQHISIDTEWAQNTAVQPHRAATTAVGS